MGHFEKSWLGKLTTLKIIHLEMDHFKNGTFRTWVTSKIDDFENESLQKKATSKMGDFDDKLLRKWHTLKIGHFGNESLRKRVNSKIDHFEEGSPRILATSKTVHPEISYSGNGSRRKFWIFYYIQYWRLNLANLNWAKKFIESKWREVSLDRSVILKFLTSLRYSSVNLLGTRLLGTNGIFQRKLLSLKGSHYCNNTKILMT